MKRAVCHQIAKSLHRERLDLGLPRNVIGRAGFVSGRSSHATDEAPAVHRSSIAPFVRHGYQFRHAGSTGHAVTLAWRARSAIDHLTGSLGPWCAIAVQPDAIISKNPNAV